MEVDDNVPYYTQRPLNVEETKLYYQNLISECQKKIVILDSQIELLEKRKTPLHIKVRQGYIDARERNVKTIACCRIYLFGVRNKTLIPNSPSKETDGRDKKTMESINKLKQKMFPEPERKVNDITGKEIYVNRKQYHRILKRRESRERLERTLSMYHDIEDPRLNPKFNRSRHSKGRKRSPSGQWMSTEKEEKLLNTISLNKRVTTRSLTSAENKRKMELSRKAELMKVLVDKAKKNELPIQQKNGSAAGRSKPSSQIAPNRQNKALVKKDLPEAKDSGIKKSKKTVKKKNGIKKTVIKID